jgi:hypothetical protein
MENKMEMKWQMANHFARCLCCQLTGALFIFCWIWLDSSNTSAVLAADIILFEVLFTTTTLELIQSERQPQKG